MSNIFFILLLSFNFLKLTPILRAFKIRLKQTDCWVIVNDDFAIKKISGHKTDSAFQRYNHVTEEEMKGIKWLEEKAEDSAPMDTYMDTCEQSKNENTRNSLKSWWASRDLNPGPDDYESSALTNWATGPNQSRYNIRQAGLKQDFSELLN